MKKNYSTPRMEVVELEKENMILTSGECKTDFMCDEWCQCNTICELLEAET